MVMRFEPTNFSSKNKGKVRRAYAIHNTQYARTYNASIIINMEIFKLNFMLEELLILFDYHKLLDLILFPWNHSHTSIEYAQLRMKR